MLLNRVKMLWPPSVHFKLPNDSTAVDYKGRRYGQYFWLKVSFGHVHFDIFPKHIRSFWTSIYFKKGELPPPVKNIFDEIRKRKDGDPT